MCRDDAGRWKKFKEKYLFNKVQDSAGIERDIPSICCHCLVSTSILGLSAVLYVGAYLVITDKASEWNVCLGARRSDGNVVASTIPGSLQKLGVSANGKAVTTSEPVRQEQKRRLEEQLKELERGMRTACRVGIFYYTNRNATLTIGTAAGIVALGSLALISRQGWEKSSNVLINIGITSGLVLSSAWTFGQLYGQSQNLESFSTKYVVAYALLNSVATSLANATAPATATNSAASPGTALDLNTEAGMAALTQSIDDQLAILNRPTFQIDDSFARSSSQKLNQLLNAQPVSPAEPASSKTN